MVIALLCYSHFLPSPFNLSLFPIHLFFTDPELTHLQHPLMSSTDFLSPTGPSGLSSHIIFLKKAPLTVPIPTLGNQSPLLEAFTVITGSYHTLWLVLMNLVSLQTVALRAGTKRVSLTALFVALKTCLAQRRMFIHWGSKWTHQNSYASICHQPCLNRNTGYVWGVGEDLLDEQIFEWVPLDDQEPERQVLINGQEYVSKD